MRSNTSLHGTLLSGTPVTRKTTVITTPIYGYVRTSPYEIFKPIHSFEQQVASLEKWALDNDVAINMVFIDDCVMGTPMEQRFGFIQLLNTIKSGQTLVTTSLDRIYGRRADVSKFLKDRVMREYRIVTVDGCFDTLDHNHAFILDMLMAALEFSVEMDTFQIDEINERIARGQESI